MTTTKVSAVLFEANGGEQTYCIYAVDDDGHCHEQRIYGYVTKTERSAAFSEAQKTAKDWARAHGCTIEHSF